MVWCFFLSSDFSGGGEPPAAGHQRGTCAPGVCQVWSHLAESPHGRANAGNKGNHIPVGQLVSQKQATGFGRLQQCLWEVNQAMVLGRQLPPAMPPTDACILHPLSEALTAVVLEDTTACRALFFDRFRCKTLLHRAVSPWKTTDAQVT